MDPYTPLNIFLTVVKERSFTRAAEKLYRTQPAISLAIQRLENDLGERLLDRSGRDLMLTEAGKLVYDCARRQENLQRELSNQLAELRNKAIYAAHVVHRYTLQEIGDHVGLHYTTVSRIIRDEEEGMLQ